MINRTARSPQGQRRLQESYEEKCERRMETHEVLRSRVNVTSCRLVEKDVVQEPEERLALSPRQQEFSRRRKLEADEEEQKRPRSSPRSHTPPRKGAAKEDFRRTLQWKDAGSTDSQLFCNNNISGMHSPHAALAVNAASTSRGFPFHGAPHNGAITTAVAKRERGSQTAAEFCADRTSTRRDSSQQTDRGTAVLDKEMFQLSEYLKEALHRELKLKQKLAILQELLTALIQASERSWKAQLNEDTLKCKVGSLEHKLQVCLQNYPKDGVKKILLDMEDQKQKYEQKAKDSLQKILEDKITAERQAQNTQRSLAVTEDECFLWKEEYDKLKGEWSELTAKHVELQNELHVLQSKLQWVNTQDVQLLQFQTRLQFLERERGDLQSRIDVLEEDNNLKREQLNSMRARLRSTEDQKLAMESRIDDLQNEVLRVRNQPPPAALHQAQVSMQTKLENDREELQKMHSSLAAKEQKCVELQSELDCLNDEYLSCFTKLRQCRDQLKNVQVKKSKRCCSSCWTPCLVLFLAIAVALFYIRVLSFIR